MSRIQEVERRQRSVKGTGQTLEYVDSDDLLAFNMVHEGKGEGDSEAALMLSAEAWRRFMVAWGFPATLESMKAYLEKRRSTEDGRLRKRKVPLHTATIHNFEEVRDAIYRDKNCDKYSRFLRLGMGGGTNCTRPSRGGSGA